jgi:hypothetical protein
MLKQRLDREVPWILRRRAATMEFVGTAVVVGIVVLLVLLGIGIVVNQLFRMKDWLKNSPPLDPPEDEPKSF